ncbi:histidine-phosphotransfer domain HPT domain-containing protein [Irpex lacteus]|nr:histidine-phosphotransfer domain HPT domain-containing protein [Irpex lacteus]
MSRLSVPPSPRPTAPADIPRAKSQAPTSSTAAVNGKPVDPTSGAAAKAAAKARSPSPELVKTTDDKSKVAAVEASSSQPEEESDLPVVDMDTFEQILELDEDEDMEFSSEMVWQYFEQAEQAFTDMEAKLQEQSLSALSSLGHYLKGSSAALGVARVQATCEKIQHYGQRRDEEKKIDLSEKVALEKITECLRRGRVEYKEAKEWLQAWYREKGIVKD